MQISRSAYARQGISDRFFRSVVCINFGCVTWDVGIYQQHMSAAIVGEWMLLDISPVKNNSDSELSAANKLINIGSG